jgi:RNA polymerase sigma-70 factor (ECF subfamily)
MGGSGQGCSRSRTHPHALRKSASIVKDLQPFAPLVGDVQDDTVKTEMAHNTQRAIEAVYREQGDRLWRALVLATGRPEIAADAVAEAFAQVLRRGAAIDDPARWVWRAAFRIAAGQLKEDGVLVPLPHELRQEASESFVDLWQALAHLTPHQRAAVVLADYAGYPHREVARVLGSSVGAVGVHVHRGRKRLRDLLEERDG